jgi:hypothetical protein
MRKVPTPFRAVVISVLSAATVCTAITCSAIASINDPKPDPLPDKTLIVDGSAVHSVGSLWNHVTNWGLIGARPGVTSPYGGAPSGRWPGAGGYDHLWSAGLWVGGTVQGQPLVSTGQWGTEFMATLDPVDIIYTTSRGQEGGQRYPWDGADDDGDGLEDEDAPDGRDNDGDGLIDEDFAAAADQEFHCVMWDTTALAQAVMPDHVPLNLKVVQRSLQWSDPAADDFIGYEYIVTNIGMETINGVHCGMFADFDIEASDNDQAGRWLGMVDVDGEAVPVNLAWTRDHPTMGGLPSVAAWVMCGVQTDAAAGLAGGALDVWSFNRFSGNASFQQGGDPTNDAESYWLLHTAGLDSDSPPQAYSDFRVLLSAPPIPALAPGETVTFRSAMVVGGSFDDMLQNAAQAVLTARGLSFDRDGDPANGAEFTVPWLRTQDAPVAAVSGHLTAVATAGGVSLSFDFRHTEAMSVSVVRRATARLGARRWDAAASGSVVTDNDPGDWPRTYDLVALAAGGEIVLDTVEAGAVAPSPLQVRASPNPFNPRLTVELALPAAGPVRVTVLDLRGRLVRELLAGQAAAGVQHVVWNGDDAAGRGVASGTYTVRLETATDRVEQRVTLLR